MRVCILSWGDWMLVIARYNGGPAMLICHEKKATARIYGIFSTISAGLNPEGKPVIKKFIGTQYTFEGQGRVVLPRSQGRKPRISFPVFHVCFNPETE